MKRLEPQCYGLVPDIHECRSHGKSDNSVSIDSTMLFKDTNVLSVNHAELDVSINS